MHFDTLFHISVQKMYTLNLFITLIHILLNNIFDIEEKYESQLIFLPLIEDASLSLPV